MGEQLRVLDALYRAWGVGTPPSEVLPYLHPEFEWVNPDYAVEPGVRYGPEGWFGAMQSADEAFESMERDVHDRIEIGDRVLCLLTFRARTRGAGAQHEVPEQHLWTFRDGKVSRLQWFHDEAEAREAAGLQPRGDLVLIAGPELAIARAHEADLRRAFEAEGRFWFHSVDSCDAALTLLGDLRQQGGRCALVVADDDTTEIGGLELIARARELHPDLKAIALVAHANYGAALQSLSDGHLDRQLVKPIAASGKQLIAEAGDLLDDWLRRRDSAERAVRLIGDPETGEAWRLRDFLSRNDVQYLLLDPEAPDGRELLRNWAEAELPEPVVVLDDGRRLGNPSLLELTEALGMPTEPKRSDYDLVIVGGGPGGLAGAVYAASEGLHTCLVEREAPGGQAGQSSRIENYLGFPAGLTGTDLSQRALAQSKRFGAEIVRLKVGAGLEADGDERVLRLADGGELRARALLISCGVSYRRLDAPGIEELTGRGVYYGVSPGEAERYAGRRVAIVGGANSAAQAALKFAEYADRVTLLIRGDSLDRGASKYLCRRIHSDDKIDVRTRTQVASVSGDDGLDRIELICPDGEPSTLEADGLFIFIGAVPHTEWLTGTLARDKHGFLITGREARDACEKGDAPAWPLARDPYPLETSLPGIFAAGDVRAGSIKRVAAAVGEGGTAVQLVHGYLAELRERETASA